MIKTDRREFLKGTAWMGAIASISGCTSAAVAAKAVCAPGMMTDFAAPALKTVRVGVIGLGARGPGAVHRLAAIPGVEVVALCDLYKGRVERQQKYLQDNGKPKAREYWIYTSAGEPRKDETSAYRALCESDLDLVYVATPWAVHTPAALCAMENGKHVAIEVPSAMTLEECFALVETSERTRRHCMQLENCCYDRVEMLTLNMVRKGLLGELVHAEGAYIHDLRDYQYRDPAKGGYQGSWRLRWNMEHTGNQYPTHGLVPLMQNMNINRGDRFEYLTSVSSAAIGMNRFAVAKFGENDPRAGIFPVSGDMSTTVIRTANGKTIMVQHDVTSARPYSRLHLVSGTQGILHKYPFRVALAKNPGGGAHEWFDFTREEAEKILGRTFKDGGRWHNETTVPEDEMLAAEYAQRVMKEYEHPLWKIAGDLARKMGGHGGMDFLMDLRLCYCLQNGLPLDMNVYDLAASCSLCELTERSAKARGASQDVPDFTRGAWKTAKPLGIESVDLEKLGLKDVRKDEAQLNV